MHRSLPLSAATALVLAAPFTIIKHRDASLERTPGDASRAAPSLRPTSRVARLVWSDEFDGPTGARPDSTRWRYEIGDGCAAGNCGWGNNEKELYTSDAANASLTGSGMLAITARVAAGGTSCYYGPCRYTSAKITTKGKYEPAFGRVEARIKLPRGQGLWPAFWMLGSGFPATPWPASGEIDIMEFRGSRPFEMSSAMHGPGYSGDKTPFVHRHGGDGWSFVDGFHTYAAEWEPGQMRFYVDDALHYTVNRSATATLGDWAFDHSFYIILNLAIGGGFDGDPASDAIFPATMLVDYVRVFAREA
ncbi:MAG: glycoside hydrolase family 16 protein [Gemmatimonadaceae bacterium]